VIGVEEIRY